MDKHPLHLKDSTLQASLPVDRAVKRREAHTGVKVPNDPADRIETFTNRLGDIFLNPDVNTRKRNLELFREEIYDTLLIKPENFPESYFELQQRIARERGQVVENIPQEVRQKMIATAIEDQRHSLDAWMDYLSSNDAMYPAWFKYYVWTQVTKLSQFDKQRGEFKKRTSSTVAPFPDIYREPLAQICDIYEKVKANNKHPEARADFDKKFPALYAELIQKSLAAQIERKEDITGKWIKYEMGDPDAAGTLYESLQGKGTGWCTAGLSTAETQIESGDFYVYYTNDADGGTTQPRLAIRMEGKNHIAEVRGILPHQEVEPILQDILDEKLKEFGSEADAYRKKSEDMRRLTILERKQERSESFTKDDLIFLYEIESPITGFGYEKDPRVAEIRSRRMVANDLSIIFQCAPSEIAQNNDEIGPNTRIYVGPLEPGIFEKLAGMERAYTAFPGHPVLFREIRIGGKSPEQLRAEIETSIGSGFARKILAKIPTEEHEINSQLVMLSVASLGFPNGASIQEIYQAADALGLGLAPPEIGPHLLLQYKDIPFPDELVIAMTPIKDGTDEGGFTITRGRDGILLLRDYFGRRMREEYCWDPKTFFVFSRNKKETESAP